MRKETFQNSYTEMTIRLLGKDGEDLSNLMDTTFSLKGGEDEGFTLDQLVALAGLIKESVKSEDQFTLNLGSTEITDDTITILLGIKDSISVVKVMRELTKEESIKLHRSLPSLTLKEVISTDKAITIMTGDEHWSFNSSHILKSDAPRAVASHRQEVLNSLKEAYKAFVELVVNNEKLVQEIKRTKETCTKALLNSETKLERKEALRNTKAAINHYNQLFSGGQVNLAHATPEILLNILEECVNSPQVDANEYKLWRDQFLLMYQNVMQSASDKNAKIPESICHEIDKLILMFLDYISINENVFTTNYATSNDSLSKKERDTLRNVAKALTNIAISPAFHLVKELFNPSEMNVFNQEAGAGGMSLGIYWKKILLITFEVVNLVSKENADTVKKLLGEIESFLSIIERQQEPHTNNNFAPLNSYTSIAKTFDPLYSSAFKIISNLNELGLTDRCFKEKPTFSKDNTQSEAVNKDFETQEYIEFANRIFARVVKLLGKSKNIKDINILLDSEIRPAIERLVQNKMRRANNSTADNPNAFFDKALSQQAANGTTAKYEM